jgi:hypothetical protein
VIRAKLDVLFVFQPMFSAMKNEALAVRFRRQQWSTSGSWQVWPVINGEA